ncbi:unnamed protein product, partial [Scytosiphon promiscuus]
GGGGGEERGIEQGGRGQWRAALKAWWDGGEAGKDAEEGIIVGPPLRRPPPGWDDPAGVAQGRWAWGTEPAGEVQLNLAPRRRHGARAVPLVSMLLLGAWATVLAATLCLVVLPFLLGRVVFSLVHLPRQWTHDTASFAVGLTILKAVTPSIYRGWCAARLALRARRRTQATAAAAAAADAAPPIGSLDAAALAARAEASLARLVAERAQGAGALGRNDARDLEQLQQQLRQQWRLQEMQVLQQQQIRRQLMQRLKHLREEVAARAADLDRRGLRPGGGERDDRHNSSGSSSSSSSSIGKEAADDDHRDAAGDDGRADADACRRRAAVAAAAQAQ